MIRTGEDEALSPKYAHVERERRWLVDRTRRPDPSGCRSMLIEDRYITGTRLRLRRMTGDDGIVSLKLSKKYEAPDPLVRPMVTAYLTEAEYAVFAGLPAAPVTKLRYAVEGFSLDCFDGALAGLELAEIEWPDDAGLRRLPPPPWAIREISDEPAYQGGVLAMYGKPEE